MSYLKMFVIFLLSKSWYLEPMCMKVCKNFTRNFENLHYVSKSKSLPGHRYLADKYYFEKTLMGKYWISHIISTSTYRSKLDRSKNLWYALELQRQILEQNERRDRERSERKSALARKCWYGNCYYDWIGFSVKLRYSISFFAKFWDDFSFSYFSFYCLLLK